MSQRDTLLFKIGLLLGLLWLATACAIQPSAPSAQPVSSATPADEATPTTGTVAFIRDNTLWIQEGDDESTAIAVEACADSGCHFYFPKWSPDGRYLLYYRTAADSTATPEIRLADLTGAVQTVTENAAEYRPADWSPDGAAIVYLLNTDRINTATNAGQQRILEVWRVDVVDGVIQNPQQRGETGFGEGCGGGGRSASAEAYERQGGFAYGYLAGIVEWTPSEILLYSDNCSSRGVGRFDLASGEIMEPYTGGLRSLTLTADGARWAAINDNNQIVVGTPESLDTTVAPTDQAAEMVFYGPVSGRLYYTTLAVTGDYTDLVEAVSALGEEVQVSPYFDTVQPALYALDTDLSTATLLYEDNDYAYARITEDANRALLFSRVETGDELYNVIQNGELTAEHQADFLPQVDVMRLDLSDLTGGTLSAEAATVWVADAEQFVYSAGK